MRGGFPPCDERCTGGRPPARVRSPHRGPSYESDVLSWRRVPFRPFPRVLFEPTRSSYLRWSSHVAFRVTVEAHRVVLPRRSRSVGSVGSVGRCRIARRFLAAISHAITAAAAIRPAIIL